MDIVNILKIKYPDADLLNDIQVGNRGNGQEIVVWNLSEDKPTEQQLKDWRQELEDELFNNKQRELRTLAYGTWQEQMDMQFHGTWQEHIEAVKQQYPLRNVE